MILVACMVVVAASVPVAGGRLGALAEVRLRHQWLIVTALGLQVLIISVAPGLAPERITAAIHLGTYALAGVFLLVNPQLPGLRLMALGGAANLAAIAANGGVMPAREAALRLAGHPVETDVFVNSGVVGDARLAWLGDVFAIPAGWPFANVFSIGDVLLVVGGAVALHTACGSRLVPAHRRATPAVVDGDGPPRSSGQVRPAP